MANVRWHLKGDPFPAQEEALRRVERAPPGYNFFMEMGLGKTTTGLNEFIDLKKRGIADKMINFVPYTIMQDWVDAATDWPLEPLVVQVWPWKKLDLKADVYVLNYESLAIGNGYGAKFLDEILQVARCYVNLDESVNIKGPTSVRTVALLKRRKDVAFTRNMSGAPMVQGPQDIWSQLKWAGVLDGVNFYQFRNRYCMMGGFRGKAIIGVKKDKVEELNRLIDACSFRALKADWLEGLPPKTYYTRHLAHNPHQAKHYKAMVQEFQVQLDSGALVNANMVITQMLKLQQISSGFIIDETGEAHAIPGPNAKLNEIKAILDTEVAGKVIIPTYFRYSTALLMKELAPYGAVGIIGGSTREETTNAKERFNRDPACRVIICQSASSKYGHTLLGDQSGGDLQSCATTIFYENSFALDDRIQIEDRNHRIGQKLGVNVIDLVSSTVERKVISALQAKRDIATEIVDAVKATRT